MIVAETRGTPGARWRRPSAGLVPLAVLTLCTLLIRVWQARESLWLDELHTAWVATGPWSEVVSRSAEGNQSPSFFAVEWLLVHVFGRSEIVLRLPGIVASGLLAVALYSVVRSWTGARWLALLPVWLTAIDPQATYYGTEARPYAIVQLLAVLHVALFAELTDRPSPLKRAAMIVGAALLFHLHFTAALVIVAELAWYGWRHIRGATAYPARTLATDMAITALLAAPAVSMLVEVFARRRNWQAFVDQQPLWMGVRMLPWAVSALTAAAIVAGWRRVRGQPTHDSEAGPSAVSMTIFWLLVPVLIAWLATATDAARLLSPRYLAASASAAVALLALALHTVPDRRLRGIAIAAVAVIGTATSPVVRGLVVSGKALDWRTDDWRGAVSYFNSHPQHGQGMVLLRSLLIESEALSTTPSDGRLVDYSLYPLTSLYPIDAARARLLPVPRTDPGHLRPDALASVGARPIAWLIFGGREEGAVAAATQICRELSEQSGSTWEPMSRRLFGTVSVTLLKRQGRDLTDARR